MAAGGGDRPDYDLAAALRKAWELNPTSRRLPVLTRVHRKAGRPERARRLYGWVLARDDSRQARSGLRRLLSRARLGGDADRAGWIEGVLYRLRGH